MTSKDFVEVNLAFSSKIASLNLLENGSEYIPTKKHKDKPCFLSVIPLRNSYWRAFRIFEKTIGMKYTSNIDFDSKFEYEAFVKSNIVLRQILLDVMNRDFDNLKRHFNFVEILKLSYTRNKVRIYLLRMSFQLYPLS